MVSFLAVLLLSAAALAQQNPYPTGCYQFIHVETPFTDRYGNRFRYKGKVNPLGQPESDHVDRVTYDVFLVPYIATPGPQDCNGVAVPARPLQPGVIDRLLADRLQ